MSGQLNVGSTSLHGIYIHIAPQGRIILHHRTRYKILSGSRFMRALCVHIWRLLVGEELVDFIISTFLCVIFPYRKDYS